MKTHTKRFSAAAATCVMIALSTAAGLSAADMLGPYQQIATIPVPSGLAGGFDISWVDSLTGMYYLADRGAPNATPPVPPGIDVIDTRKLSPVSLIPLPTGPNGVLVFHLGSPNFLAGTLVAGGNDSKTYFVDLANPSAPPLGVSTGGAVRADELAYDPVDRVILIANPDEASATPPGIPFVTFISTVTHTVLGKIIYDGAFGHGPAATGIEQPVWNPINGKFYINIPATPANPAGELDEIDPVAMKIVNTFSTPCPMTGPLGLAIIPGNRLVNSCGDVFDIATGMVIATQTNISADEIWYNSGDHRVYFGSFTTTPVVDGLPPYSFIANLPWTGSFPTTFSHSVAVDSTNNYSFVPVSNKGVLVFTDDQN